jgi:hypothetical protein
VCSRDPRGDNDVVDAVRCRRTRDEDARAAAPPLPVADFFFLVSVDAKGLTSVPSR